MLNSVISYDHKNLLVGELLAELRRKTSLIEHLKIVIEDKQKVIECLMDKED